MATLVAVADNRHRQINADELAFLQGSANALELSYGIVGKLLGANLNTTADQPVSLVGPCIIERAYVTNGSISMSLAAGGLYTATSKGGTALIAAAQVYAGLTGGAADVVVPTIAVIKRVADAVYFALTVAQGAAATADLYLLGLRVP